MHNPSTIKEFSASECDDIEEGNANPRSKARGLRALAFYLPQFYPIPENDQAWGKGFTEWRNVVKARPLFEGHYQPHLPTELGFYDLRVSETREAQAALARKHGIHGFVYYHYWFNGRRVLERPVDEVIASREPDFPFCLCWANENWTRRWDGMDDDVILKQEYSRADDLAHIRSLLRVFADPRYVRVNEKPLLLIYRMSHLPEPATTIEAWQSEAIKAGFPGLYLANVESNFAAEHGLAARLPINAAVEFAPDVRCFGHRIRRWTRRPPTFRKVEAEPWVSSSMYEYRELRDNMLNKAEVPYLRYRCVTPMWDNTPRRATGATMLVGSTPELYEDWLYQAVEQFVPPTPDENLVFINAWNEWAEGAHLEPCSRWGDAYLRATKRALMKDGAISTKNRRDKNTATSE